MGSANVGDCRLTAKGASQIAVLLEKHAGTRLAYVGSDFSPGVATHSLFALRRASFVLVSPIFPGCDAVGDEGDVGAIARSVSARSRGATVQLTAVTLGVACASIRGATVVA